MSTRVDRCRYVEVVRRRAGWYIKQEKGRKEREQAGDDFNRISTPKWGFRVVCEIAHLRAIGYTFGVAGNAGPRLRST